MESTFQEKPVKEIKIEGLEVLEGEKILQDNVVKDRREIQSLLKIENLIENNNINISEFLEAIQAQRFDKDGDLADKSGFNIKIDGNYLKKNDWGGLIIEDERKNNILEYFKNSDKFKKIKYKSSNTLKAINSVNIKYLSLFSNDTNLSILEAIQAQRFDKDGDLADKSGFNIKIDGNYLKKNDWDFFEGTDENLKTLYNEIFTIAASELPSGMKESIISYIKEPEDSIMDRMNQIMEDQQKSDEFIEIKKILLEINAIKRRSEFSLDFLE